MEPRRPRVSGCQLAGLRVLVVDDDADVGEFLRDALSSWNYDVTSVASGREAVDLISRQIFDAALVDIWMPEMDGLQVLEQIKRHDPALEVVMLTGNPMVETAVQALKSGAYDYLMKPLNLDELQHLLRQVFEKRFLSREVHSLRSQLADQLTAKDLVGASSSMAQVREVIARVADADSPVLIEGESGTGKELVAAAIHRQSGRGKGPFVPVNCSAIPADLMESEFFGHVRGAFSGAVADALGLFRSAHGGTLFLDEVAELPPALQAKGDPAGRLDQDPRRQCAGDRGDQQEPGSRGEQRQLPPGPLLPAQRRPHRGATAAGTPGGHSGADRVLPPAVQRALPPRGQGHLPRRHGRLDQLRLPRQRSRARECPRAGVRPRRARRDQAREPAGALGEGRAAGGGQQRAAADAGSGRARPHRPRARSIPE
ncbi:MAG: hypothetical protein DME05_20105 [Candidatus Rokuibacteriota bacterium]|nr:MAG: hypothetical protein DME05_20105 [Candidatus Rokubacteria bacterium]